jgi:hypothetical protein
MYVNESDSGLLAEVEAKFEMDAEDCISEPLFRKLGSLRSWGGSLGRKARSFKNRLSRVCLNDSSVGDEVGRTGGFSSISSSNSTLGTLKKIKMQQK